MYNKEVWLAKMTDVVLSFSKQKIALYVICDFVEGSKYQHNKIKYFPIKKKIYKEIAVNAFLINIMGLIKSLN